MKTFFNGVNNPAKPYFLFSYAFITDFQEMVNIENVFFTKQYSLVLNNSFLHSEII